MSFVGKWKMYFSENLQEFMRACKYDEDVIAEGKTADMQLAYEREGDNFTSHIFVNGKEAINKFTLGKETELTGPFGFKVTGTTVLDNGKLVFKCDKLSVTREVQGDELMEISVIGSVTMIRKFKRVA